MEEVGKKQNFRAWLRSFKLGESRQIDCPKERIKKYRVQVAAEAFQVCMRSGLKFRTSTKGGIITVTCIAIRKNNGRWDFSKNCLNPGII